MKLDEYDIVKLKYDLPEYNLKKGDIGVIVMVYSPASKDYEVEFCDKYGVTQALVTLKEKMLEKVEPSEENK